MEIDALRVFVEDLGKRIRDLEKRIEALEERELPLVELDELSTHPTFVVNVWNGESFEVPE